MKDTGPEDFPIGESLPNTDEVWALEEVVYTQYGYDETLPEGDRVYAKIRSYAVRETDIKGFVEKRRKREAWEGKGEVRRWRRDNQREDDRPLNIYVRKPCWVVIELDPDVDWQFEPNRPGVTTKVAQGQDNCDLMHVMTDGQLARSVAPAEGECRLLYFVVQGRREEWDHQGFLCHIVHGRKRREDPIDPDIPNDGGRFPARNLPLKVEADA